tara:strand:+ start:255 stop:1115 length:861 start_codon:yes stop_codon:yes gene_type:complete
MKNSKKVKEYNKKSIYLLKKIINVNFDNIKHMKLISKKIAHRGITPKLKTELEKIVPKNTNISKKFENTLISFLISLNSGFGIETDCQLTKDGHIILFHDFKIDKTEINLLTLKEIRDNTKNTLNQNEFLKITHKFPLLKQFNQNSILRPELKDLLLIYRTLNSSSTLNLEIKVQDHQVDLGQDILRKAKQECKGTENILFSSFNHDIEGIQGYLADTEKKLISAISKTQKESFVIIDYKLKDHKLLNTKSVRLISYNIPEIKDDNNIDIKLTAEITDFAEIQLKL